MSRVNNDGRTYTEVDDEGRWQAVQNRDGSRDGDFVYGVRSTRVYCRPSCPSRRPRRENILFFASPEEAERAGLRPCRRCAPDQEATAQAKLIELARRRLEEHTDGPLKLSTLGQELGVSPYHLQRTFKRLTGVTPRQYWESCRIARLKTRLRAGEYVTSALYDAGFGSSSRLYERARSALGMTPRAYRKGGQGVLIRYAIADSPLGRLLLAATDHGICAVKLGESDAELEALLKAEYPAAEIRRDESGLREWVAALLEHIGGERARMDVPIDIRGTDFQRRVWEALLTIPYGSTRSYGDVARSLGHPRAARAVARACASNPAAVVVPCHRVVRSDGALGGYRWGLERKQALLATERERTGAPQPSVVEGVAKEGSGSSEGPDVVAAMKRPPPPGRGVV